MAVKASHDESQQSSEGDRGTQQTQAAVCRGAAQEVLLPHHNVSIAARACMECIKWRKLQWCDLTWWG